MRLERYAIKGTDFAGMLLMPEFSFRRMFLKFKEESDGDEEETIIRLMSYYQVPYMAALIRSLELNLVVRNEVQEESFDIERDQIKQKLTEMWLDESIMEPSGKDDYIHIEAVVDRVGSEFVKEKYINERTVKKALKNMRELYTQIKGD